MSNLPDVQKNLPEIQIPINRVGVRNFKIPISIMEKTGTAQDTVANVSVFIDVKENQKGANMSRLPIAVLKYSGKIINREILENLCDHIIAKNECDLAQVVLEFDYFISKISPINKEPGIINYPVIFDLTKVKNGRSDFFITVKVPATSLCPCSKEISDFGAHNQRCYITIKTEMKKDGFVYIEDLIEIGESSASSPIYSILKRPDEKYVTEYAYNNPKFVEDIVRECYIKLMSLENITSKFSIDVESDESIHYHQAVAKIF